MGLPLLRFVIDKKQNEKEQEVPMMLNKVTAIYVLVDDLLKKGAKRK